MRCSALGDTPTAVVKRRRSWRSDIHNDAASEETPPLPGYQSIDGLGGDRVHVGFVGQPVRDGLLEDDGRLVRGAGRGERLFEGDHRPAPQLVDGEIEIDEL